MIMIVTKIGDPYMLRLSHIIQYNCIFLRTAYMTAQKKTT